MDESTIGGYELSDELAVSKRFRAFRASRRMPDGVRSGTLYLMTEEVRRPELFIETVDAIREAWPFANDAQRDVVLPRAQLWTGRPWFFVPERLPVVASKHHLGPAAFASLRAQLRWLEEFQPPGGQRCFAHGDVRKERIALIKDEPLLIAPGWVAAADYADGRSLSHVRGDDIWHLGKLWIKESDRSFVPEGLEVDPDEAGRRLPRARLEARAERPARPAAAQRPAAARPEPAAAAKPAAAKPAPARPAAEPPSSAARPAAPERAAARPHANGVNGMNGASNGLATHRPAAPPLAERARPASPAAVTAPPPREAPPQREPVREAPPQRELPREAAPREPAPREPAYREAPPQREPVREALSWREPPASEPANDVPARPQRPAAVSAPPAPPTPPSLPPALADSAPPVPIHAPEPVSPAVARMSAPPAAPSYYPSQAPPPPVAPAPAPASNRVGAIAMFVVLVAVLVVAVLLFGR